MATTANELDVRRDDNGVVWVTLDRPDKLNALTWGMLEGLHGLFTSLPDDRAARIVVLRGRGRGFCGGVDLADTPYVRAILGDGPPEARSVGEGLRSQQWQSRLVLEMRRAPQPIIALVHGPAYGAGLALALASDVLLVGSERAALRGVHQGGALGLRHGRELLPHPRGRPVARVGADAHRRSVLGRARGRARHRVARWWPTRSSRRRGAQLAERMLANTPFGLRLTKECLRFSFDAPGLEAAIAMEDRNQMLASGQDALEAFKAAREKRKPNFLPG